MTARLVDSCCVKQNNELTVEIKQVGKKRYLSLVWDEDNRISSPHLRPLISTQEKVLFIGVR